MKADSLKLEIIEWITSLEDEGILTSLLQIKKSSENGDWADNLTPNQLESLQKGLKDKKDKKVLSSKEFWSSYGRKI